ncbi:MAG TPA: Imm1 family immunity protein [Actinokineospora sp.]|nr:Imm1 family immunity protein [Actinokineospora sp.]
MTFVLEAVYRNDKPPAMLKTAEDIAAFVAELLKSDWEHTAAAVYARDEAADPDAFPDHELLVGVEPTRAALRYTGDGTWYSHGDHVNPNGVEFAYFGTGHDFPADSEVPLSLVRQAMAELLAGGGKRPTCVTWQE